MVLAPTDFRDILLIFFKSNFGSFLSVFLLLLFFHHTCLVLSPVCWNVMSKCFLAEVCLFLSLTLFLAFCVDALSGCSQRSGDPATLEATLATEVFKDLHDPASWCRLAFCPPHHEELCKVLFPLSFHRPHCRRLLIPHKATCLSCDVCCHSHNQLSQIPVHHLLYESQGYPCRS